MWHSLLRGCQESPKKLRLKAELLAWPSCVQNQQQKLHSCQEGTEAEPKTFAEQGTALHWESYSQERAVGRRHSRRGLGTWERKCACTQDKNRTVEGCPPYSLRCHIKSFWTIRLLKTKLAHQAPNFKSFANASKHKVNLGEESCDSFSESLGTAIQEDHVLCERT